MSSETHKSYMANEPFYFQMKNNITGSVYIIPFSRVQNIEVDFAAKKPKMVVYCEPNHTVTQLFDEQDELQEYVDIYLQWLHDKCA